MEMPAARWPPRLKRNSGLHPQAKKNQNGAPGQLQDKPAARCMTKRARDSNSSRRVIYSLSSSKVGGPITSIAISHALTFTLWYNSPALRYKPRLQPQPLTKEENR